MARLSPSSRRGGRFLVACLIALVAPLAIAGVAAAAEYVFPSTNAENAAAGFPHVTEVAAGPSSVTLEFVNETNSLAFFEYRVDGVVQPTGTPHPVVMGDVVYPGVCVDSRAIGPAPGCAVGSLQMTFDAAAMVEVRLALGGERDWDFDWTPFLVAPITKASCKKGGWVDLGFANQGQCIKFANSQ